MDTTTNYLGLQLEHPLMAGASPLAHDVDSLKRCADAGSSAIVVHSIFEEQVLEGMSAEDMLDSPVGPTPEAQDYFPHPESFSIGPDALLEFINEAKQAVDIPIIGSINGTNKGSWLNYAKRIEEAGADALEITIYDIPTDPTEGGQSVEQRTLDLVSAVRKAVQIPIAVKLSPFYSSLPNFATKLDEAGVNGLVLFNRFFHPDINVEELEVERRLVLSNPGDLLLRLRWLAILSACERNYDLAITGGVYSGLDAIKAIMCGASVVQLVSTLLVNGPGHAGEIRDAMVEWMEQHEYKSIAQMRGSLDLSHCPDASTYERANYVHILQGWDEKKGVTPGL